MHLVTVNGKRQRNPHADRSDGPEPSFKYQVGNDGESILRDGEVVSAIDIANRLNRLDSVESYAQRMRDHFLKRYQELGVANELNDELRLARFCSLVAGCVKAGAVHFTGKH